MTPLQAEADEQTERVGPMPAYGVIPWQELKALVAEATIGHRKAEYVDTDDSYHLGHQIISMNWNSLNRIVSAALASNEKTERDPGVLEALTADTFRALGWTVAVHNDYRQNGEPHTFWLFTKDDRAIKGEGRTDAEALAAARSALDARKESK